MDGVCEEALGKGAKVENYLWEAGGAGELVKDKWNLINYRRVEKPQ